MDRFNRSLFLIAAGLLLFARPSYCQEKEPQSITSARENFNREFVRELGVIQRKYIDALETYQRNFSREGKLEAAREAGLELRYAKEWATIPPEQGLRKLENKELASFLEKYEFAISKALDSTIARYVEKLNYLLKASHREMKSKPHFLPTKRSSGFSQNGICLAMREQKDISSRSIRKASASGCFDRNLNLPVL